jgi:hypothetical protein
MQTNRSVVVAARRAVAVMRLSSSRASSLASITFALAASLSACGGDEPPDVADAVPQGASAILSWTAPSKNVDGSPLTPVAGYYIYYGTSPGALNQVVQIKDPAVSSYEIKPSTPGIYYFSILAYTAAGERGAASASLAKVIR